MVPRSILLLAGLWAILLSSANAAEEPRVFILDGAHLARMRDAVRQHPEEYAAALEELRKEADEALDRGPWSVMDKPNTPPSGDKHDYYSVGPYWWPDPSKSDGLPYINRDGEVNPDRSKYDNVGFGRTTSAVKDLATAWYFTGETKYAEHAALLLRTWFLDPATKMNPHLEFGQAIPGRTDGRGIGIIDTVGLINFIDAVGLLEPSAAWSESDHRQLQDWFRQYLHWLLTSQHGHDEANTKNNHAIWYDAQVICYALFVGDETTAKNVSQEVGPRRIATQIEPDGRMPLELARTKSFSYTLYNLRAFVAAARLAEHADVDLWSYRSKDGSSIERALDWFEPFVTGQQEWTYEQIARFRPSQAARLYFEVAHFVDNPAYRRIAATIDDPVTLLLWPPLDNAQE